jgi:hypothetical protein
MARVFRRNSAGIDRILKGADAQAMVRQAAERIAAEAAATSGLPVEVNEYETDRAAASVVITHALGIGSQAKDGTLTRAAASIGLEVRGQ